MITSLAPSLLVQNLTIGRGDTVVLGGVSFSVRGGVTAVLGPNGSGKTSLLRTLATVVPPMSGEINVEGRSLHDHAARIETRSALGYGPQANRFHPRARVFDAVDYIATLRLDLPTSARQREVWRVLDLLGLSREASTRIGTLSEGYRQRITLAQALLGPPRLAILDEPLVALDPEIRLHVQQVLSDLGRTTTVVMASHLVNEACEIADHVVVLGEGDVAFTGTPSELVARSPEPGATPAHGYLAVRAGSAPTM